MKSAQSASNNFLESVANKNQYGGDKLKKNSSLHASYFSNVRVRVHRSDEANFVEATRQGFYNYWLTLEEVTDIAHLEYNNFKDLSQRPHSDFQSSNSLAHLIGKITSFQIRAKQTNIARETLILNIGYAHWITMVLSYQQERFTLYYVNSLNYRLPAEIQQFLEAQHILLNNLSEYLFQYMNNSNVGLWTLEIAENLNTMLDKNLTLDTMKVIFSYLPHQYDANYFNERRKVLAGKLDQYTHYLKLAGSSASDLSPITEPFSFASVEEPMLKKARIEWEGEAVKLRLSLFVETYISYTCKMLGVYHIIAKGDRLSLESLKTELKIGATAALLGMTVTQGVAGSIPSLVATVRSMSAHYYLLSKDKACKITKAFENVLSGELSGLLAVVAVEIFHSFESQFMSVRDKAGYKIAIEKLAEDAAARSLNYIIATTSQNIPPFVTRELLSIGVILGHSDNFFDPSIKKMRFRVAGASVLDTHGKILSTANLYEQTGVRVFNIKTQQTRFYKLKKFLNSFYGYRLLLSWEKQTNGELKEIFIKDYQQQELPLPQLKNQFEYTLWNYHYVLKDNRVDQEANDILDKLKKTDQIQLLSHVTLKNTLQPQESILFNLRKPISNFSGRKEVLHKLHKLLISNDNLAVISQGLSDLTLDEPDEPVSSSTTAAQTALSGLGGIGKTQLALRYAELYAPYYDNNVIWINADTKGDVINSLKNLAVKLNLSEKNTLGTNKEFAELLSEIYQFFSNRKSLFIFDNVENYQEFEEFLPKSLIGNTPVILITSRFNHWKNIFQVLLLNVFNDQEALEFIKKELNINTSQQDAKIKELTRLVQGLPLALQQAVAYITMQQNVDSTFEVDNYIEYFKTNAEKILNFKFSEYSNDPYFKAVFITWEITLGTIKNVKTIGKTALNILNIMAYLYPDNIKNDLFLNLYPLEEVSRAIHLLKSYSMINTGSQTDISIVHRLVQKVVRINLEKHFVALEKNAENIIFITQDYYINHDIGLHYIYFLLHMVKHDQLVSRLKLGSTRSSAIDVFILSNYNIDLVYFYDAAYLILTKKDYAQFIGEALFLYIKNGLLFFLSETIFYLEKQLEEGLLTATNTWAILDYRYRTAINYPGWLASSDDDLQERQIVSIHLTLAFQKRFTEKFSICELGKRQSREVSCRSRESDNQANKIGLIQHHLHLLRQAIHLTSEKLLNKINLPDFLQEEWSEVALNLGKGIENSLLADAFNSTWVSEELSAIAGKGLLEKNLLFNRTQVPTTFQTKKMTLNKAKSFLTHVMKITRPFRKRGPSSIGNGYTVAKELKDFKKLKALQGNDASSSLSDLTGLALSETDRRQSNLDIETFLNLMEDISLLSEDDPMITIDIWSWAKNNINQTIRQVKQIERYVHLNKEEKLTESLRALMHLTPSDYLEAKAMNNQLVKNALAFLKNIDSIQNYVFPSAYSSSQLVKDNQIFLQEKQSIKLDSTMPEKLTYEEGYLFCLSGILGNESYVKSSQWVYIEPYPPFMQPSLVTTYLCEGALGVELTKNRTGNATLIALDTGTDIAIGVPDRFNIFLVNNGDKNYTGGHAGNLFFIQGDKIKGTLEGGNRENIILLENFLPHAAYILFDKQGLLCEQSEAADLHCKEGLQLKHIQHVYGRKQLKDIIFVSEGIEYVDGFSGKNEDECDYIYLTRYVTRYLELVLRPDTIIYAFDYNFLLKITLINYRLSQQVGNVSVLIRSNEAIEHRFTVEFSLNELDKIVFSENEIYFIFLHKKNFFNLRISDPFSRLLLRTIQFSFASQQEFRLAKSNYLYIRELNTYTVNKLVNYYSTFSQRLQMVLRIFAVPSKIMLQVGYAGQPIILYNELSIKNYLISQGDKTIYLIKPPLQAIEFPMPEIVIVSLGEKSALNTLDLSEVWKQARRICPRQAITTEIVEQNQSLILSLKVDHYWLSMTECVPLESIWPIVTIKLHNVLADNSYQNLEVILDNSPLIIAFDKRINWHLQAYPLIFGHEKAIIIITQNDLISEANILVLKDMNHRKYSFFCHNQTDLILTNVFDPLTPVDEFFTVVYSQFYQVPEMRERVLTTKLTFLDQQVILKKEEENIINAASFDFNQINFTQNRQKLFNKERADDQIRIRRQVKTTQKLMEAKNVRSKKQVNRKLYFNRLGKSNVSFFDTITSDTQPSFPLAKPSLSYNESYSHSNVTPFLTNNTDINSQSVFLTWIYHRLWGKNPKLLNFRPSVEMENENQVYKAIDYYERLQNDSSYTHLRH
ncbi:MAG: NB-ARC domain-containing protein [Candidatus Rickettsiella isopodorum]